MIKALVLTGDGINCEQETAFALEQAGARCTIIHISDLISNPEHLKQYQILALPGGFSFGDEVSSGKILAIKLRYALGEALQRYIEGDNLVIGICNGFQALVKLGILPQSRLGQQQVSLVHNRQRRFINQWVSLTVPQNTLFLQDMSRLELPIRHGEGRLIIPVEDEGNLNLTPHIALQYETDVNGSFMNIAGLINARGNVLGLMPHPEAFIRWTQHPAWTGMTETEMTPPPAGRQVFLNMVNALRN